MTDRPELPDLKYVSAADVYKRGVLAGRLRRQDGGVAFSYYPDYLTRGGPAVATTLPLGSEVTWRPGGAVPAFFAGLLPEGRRLTALRRRLKTSPDDDLTQLLAVAEDAIGDVQVVPEGAVPTPVEPLVSVASFDEVSFAGLFADEAGGRIDRVGLPGVQEKVSAGMIAFPVAARDRRYILKLDPPEYPHLVANEAFFLEAARDSGLSTVDAEVVTDRAGRQGLLVQRFDRVPANRVDLRAFEDGCQVLDLPPASKYQVTAERALAGLTAPARAPLVVGRALLQQVVFGYVSCNGDQHARNLGITTTATGEWMAAPAFDLPSSHPYGDNTLALSINGKHREDVGRTDLLSLAASVGLPERAAARVIDDVAERSQAWIDRLDQLPFDGRTIHRLRRAVTYRRDRLAP